MFYTIKGVTKDYIWGGSRLGAYGYPGERVAEAWVLSFHPDGMASTGGRPVADVLTRDTWGAACAPFAKFPVLIKLIDAKDNLSVQVHPSDEYALKNEGQFGKTEMWYVLGADEGAGLYVGFREAVDKATFMRLIAENRLTEALNFFPVKPGDCYFIPAGTVHAIGRGCLIAEVQQNSNLTYRVYDYGRLGADGRPRPLHIDKAAAVADLGRYTPRRAPGGALAECRYFRTELAEGRLGRDDSFTSVLFTEDGAVDGVAAPKGTSCFIPAGARADVCGRAIVTTVPPAADPSRTAR